MRSDAAIACCRLALTRLSFFAGPYIRSSVADERARTAPVVRSSAARSARLPYTQRAGHAEAADQLHQRRQARQRRRDLHVGAEQMVAGAVELLGLVRLGAERLDDAMAGERLGADVRELLERFLAAPRRPPHALAEPDQRIDDQRRAGEADDRQPRVVVEQQRRVADQRQRLARQIAGRLRHRLLHLADVVVDARQQLAGGAVREEAGRLVRGCAGRARCAGPSRRAGRRRPSGTTRRTSRCPSAGRRRRSPRRRAPTSCCCGSTLSKIGLMSAGQAGRADRVDDHPDDRPRQPAAIRPRVAEQASQRVTLSITDWPPSADSRADACDASPTRCATIVSRSANRGCPAAARPAPCAAPRRARPDRPARRGASVHGTARPVTRSTVSITSRTECGRPGAEVVGAPTRRRLGDRLERLARARRPGR